MYGSNCSRCPYNAYCTGCTVPGQRSFMRKLQRDQKQALLAAGDDAASSAAEEAVAPVDENDADADADAEDEAGDELVQLRSSEAIVIEWLTCDFYHSETANRVVNFAERNGAAAGDAAAAADDATLTLEKCFAAFTTEENLGPNDHWFCPNCKDLQPAAKQFHLWKLPDVVVVHLKRFQYSKSWRDKIEANIHYPMRGLNLAPFVAAEAQLHNEPDTMLYDLVGVVNHFGGMSGGHYTAFALHAPTNQWYNYNDSHCSKAQPHEVVNSEAYVLFYQRRHCASAVNLDLLRTTDASPLADPPVSSAVDAQPSSSSSSAPSLHAAAFSSALPDDGEVLTYPPRTTGSSLHEAAIAAALHDDGEVLTYPRKSLVIPYDPWAPADGPTIPLQSSDGLALTGSPPALFDDDFYTSSANFAPESSSALSSASSALPKQETEEIAVYENNGDVDGNATTTTTHIRLEYSDDESDQEEREREGELEPPLIDTSGYSRLGGNDDDVHSESDTEQQDAAAADDDDDGTNQIAEQNESVGFRYLKSQVSLQDLHPEELEAVQEFKRREEAEQVVFPVQEVALDPSQQAELQAMSDALSK
ncbi:hypothetical protein CAOG_008488 [Capsaspora owczarzaki ATCC 30864]|uniref:ubiquitinyl hydrolase 1 n=2 Tax=Capsaspora owczarzaki (strain ATCC 30864) TaxID=595528 RepID=A0A0D2X0X3_CAPO3|nr:hypothetical protein CAOG_008488 [Capsaspora owczarzaki ATCC 30864]